MNNLEQFVELLNIHGSNLETWQEKKSQWARDLIANDAQARVAFDEQRTLEKMLDEHLPHTMNTQLIAEIIAKVSLKRVPQKEKAFSFWSNWFSDSLWRPVFAATFPLIIGILGGIYYPQEPTTSAESIALLAFSDLGTQYQDEYLQEYQQ